MNDLVVLAHEYDALNKKSNYVILLVARILAAVGFKVVLQKGLKNPHKGRAVINQVDLTVTPPDYAAYMDSFPVAINGRLLDISKTVVCSDETFVTTEEAFDGPVIVKTRFNYGGVPEQRVLHRQGILPSDPPFDWRTTPYLVPKNYPIFQGSEQVPTGVWENPNLVVQRLLTEQDDAGLYCLRFWYVLGDKGFHVLNKARAPVVKGADIIERHLVDMETPANLVSAQAELGVDFGRFDYVIIDGQAVILDVNRSPTMSEIAIGRYRRRWLETTTGMLRYLD